MAKTLAVIYRPKKFEDVSEQRNVIGILKNQLEFHECKNAYLFCGGAGTGKTTCARIFANELNGGKGTPIEVDAASNNGVENVRGIIEQSKYSPLEGQYKVYIIDECHMLSMGAWNAMLKLLEEPPARTIFIFCTTDPQKIPVTILSRVQRYDFQRISTEGIVARLRYICDSEKLEADNNALEFLAKVAQGGMRDAISLMDKCFSYSKKLDVSSVVEALGLVSYDKMFELLAYMYGAARPSAVGLVDDLYQSGTDIKQFLKSFTTFLIDLAIYKSTQRFLITRIPLVYKRNIEEAVVHFETDDLLDIVDEAFKVQSLIKNDPAPLPIIQAFILKNTRRANK